MHLNHTSKVGARHPQSSGTYNNLTGAVPLQCGLFQSTRNTETSTLKLILGTLKLIQTTMAALFTPPGTSQNCDNR